MCAAKHKYQKYLIPFLCFCCISTAIPQDKAPPNKKAEASKREIRKQEKKEYKERKQREKEERKLIKAHHKRIQTKKVRKRMKKSLAKATRYNENRREFFLVRWLKKKKKV